MVSKKLALTSGLIVASLSLTGCSGLQDMINNKIASTTKQVADGVNSEVAKTTDALKAQGEIMQKDAGIAAAQLKSEFGIVDGEIYKNTEFGFSLQFPKSWGKVTAGPAKEVQLVSNKVKDITLTSEDKKKTYTIGMIDKNFKEEDGLEYSVNLGTGSKYTFFGPLGLMKGEELGGKEDPEIKAINKSFMAL